MAQLFLYLNSALYLALAVWGTIAPQRTATRLGYLTMSDRGRAEYLTTYGGLQLGLAVLFLLFARAGDATLGAVGLEALLLLVAIWLLYSTSA